MSRKLHFAASAGASAAAATSATLANQSVAYEVIERAHSTDVALLNSIKFNISSKEIDGFKNEMQNNDSPNDMTNIYIRLGHAIPNLEYDPETKDLSSLSKDKAESVLGEFLFGDYKKVKGSLRVTSQKEKFKDDKWKGSLTWLGSFANKDKGFITFNIAETHPKSRLKLTGVFFFLEKDLKRDKGVTKYMKEVSDTDNKFLDKHNFRRYFPKPYGYTREGKFDELYYNNWNFMKDDAELYKICEVGECDDSSSPRTVEGGSGAGVWRSGTWYENNCHNGPNGYWCDHVYEGSGDADDDSSLQGWDFMYGKDEFDLKKYLAPFYRGYWKPVEYY